VSEITPTARSPVTETASVEIGEVSLVDRSLAQKWRVFDGVSSGLTDVTPGTSRRIGDRLAWSVSPSEWTVVGPRPDGAEVVDLTHVRAMFALTGQGAPDVLARLCALDLGEEMFPSGAAARTLVAGVATEIVRDDHARSHSYRVLPSRSFAAYLWDAILDTGNHGPRSSRT
jgi:heterotetrameric sarcosine oxidase gamma subunit